jgi:hypothetical protein
MFPGRPGFARVAAVAVAGASCLAAVACGSSTASSLSTAARATSAPDPLASLTASKVLAEAQANLKAASSLTMAGSTVDSGQSDVVNLGLKPGQGCEGTVGESGQGTFKIVVIGTTTYIDASNQFWKSQGGPHGAAIAALVNGRYIKTSSNVNGMSAMAKVCDLSKNVAPYLTGTFTKGKLTSLGGTRVLPLVNSDEGEIYVTDTSKPEIVEVIDTKDTGNGTGKVTFSVGARVTLAAPPASQVIDGSLFGL